MATFRWRSDRSLQRAITFFYVTGVITVASFCQEIDKTVTAELSRAEKAIQEAIPRGQPVFLVPPDNVVRAQVLFELIAAPSSNKGSVPLKIQILGAEVIDDLDLSDREIVSEVSLEHCTLDGEVNFERAVAHRGISFVSSTFKRCPTFQGATIEGDFELSGVQFLDDQHEVNFQRLTTESEFRLDQAFFFGGANFFHTHSKGQVYLNNASSGSGKRVLFDNLKAEDDILGTTVLFGGPVSFDFADGKGIYFTECKFAGPCNFDSNTISRSVSFRNCTFSDRFSFRQDSVGQDFDLRSAQFLKPRDTSVRATTENGLIDVDLWRTGVGGLTRFNNATFSGLLSLEACDLEDLDIEGIQPWLRGKRMTSLIGATIRRFEGRSAKDLLLFIDRSEFDPGIYTKLESFLKAEGEGAEADQVFIHEQTRDRHARLKGIAHLRNWVWGAVTGYGREVWLALVWSAVVVAIGSVLFWRSSDMELRDEKFVGRKYNPIWFSLDLFAPIIDLEEASVWCPKPDRIGKWFYFRIHRILGWILVPIGIVAITGVLQGASQ
jgi:hypothetical protein